MAPTTRSHTSSSPFKRTNQPNKNLSSTSSTSSSSSSSSKSPSTSSSTTPKIPLIPPTDPTKPTLLILGTGWAGWTLSQDLTPLSTTHNIIILSPSRTMTLTPLLASATCSIFDFRIAEEPVRRISNSSLIKKYQVWVSDIDFIGKKVSCKGVVGSNGSEIRISNDSDGGAGEFILRYDKLILSPGCETNTFDTPGVMEYCFQLKTISDASSLREGILDCFELASLPVLTERERRDILHFVIVGGGPTGTELAAELDELVEGSLGRIYPDLKGMVRISVYDVADRMLGPFNEKLAEYAMERFRRRGVRVCMGRKIEGFEKGVMRVEGEKVGFGMAVWAAGNKMGGLMEGLKGVKRGEGMGRLMTDGWLRVLKDGKEGEEREVVQGVYALGDAADIEGNGLPTTAEVAVQKAKWLVKYLMDEEKGKKFQYKQKAVVAYIGRGDGVVEGKKDWTGMGAWLAWRSGNLEWTRSWRRRVIIVLNWVMNKLDGREIARR